MKRFHVHVSVNDLQQSVLFYSTLFGSLPAVQHEDYAKWLLDDPRINFAISQRGESVGINHLGMQVESDEELHGMKQQLQNADANLVQQTGTSCCYAKSDKYWVSDPSGIAWETFHTLGNVPVFSDNKSVQSDSGCCIPIKSQSETNCCIPSNTTAGKACCG
jgi:extradiol dioxygenase family protein